MALLSFTGNIHIIGLGVAETALLTPLAEQALLSADAVIGSERQLHTVADQLNTVTSSAAHTPAIVSILLPPLSELTALIQRLAQDALKQTTATSRHRIPSLVILASGDPLHYGIGRWLSQKIPAQQLHFYPAVSSIQAACHQVGLSLQDATVLSLHGRPLAKIRTQLQAQQPLLVLTDQHSQPHHLAAECIAANFAPSTITVCENLGYPHQRVRTFSTHELTNNSTCVFDPLHVSIIHVQGMGGVLPTFPGIPDEHYITGAPAGKGMISKREVRLVILSMMQTQQHDVIWDIGAGCGGVTVELAYWNQSAQVYAIEHHRERLEHLADNIERFGVGHNTHIIKGRAPEALADLPAPHKIFIGGSDGELASLLHYAWQQLPVGGVLVASAVVASSKAQLTEFAQYLSRSQKTLSKPAGIESVEVAIQRGHMVDDRLEYQAKLPVNIMAFTKYSLHSDTVDDT